MKDKIYGEAKLRVCSGTLAKTGSKRKGYFRVQLKPIPSGEGEGEGENKDKIAIHATYTDRTGTEQTLEPGDIINVIPVASKSAYEIPRKWIVPVALVTTTFIAGPIALNYVYLKVSEGVFWIAFSSLAAAQTASVFIAGAALNGGIARAIVETNKGQATVEGDPFRIGMLCGLLRQQNHTTHTQI